MKIDGKYLVMQTNGWDYDIPLKDLATVEGLEKWLMHMTEKTWFDNYMATQMIAICERQFNYKFNGKTEYDRAIRLRA
jgi:hypothetical protein